MITKVFRCVDISWNQEEVKWIILPYITLLYISKIIWASSIAVRALAYSSEDPWFETHFKSRAGRSLAVHPAANADRCEAKELATLPHKTDSPRQVYSLTDASQRTDRI